MRGDRGYQKSAEYLFLSSKRLVIPNSCYNWLEVRWRINFRLRKLHSNFSTLFHASIRRQQTISLNMNKKKRGSQFDTFLSVSFRLNLIKFHEQKKYSHDVIEINCARQKAKSESKNFHENFPISVTKMYHVIRYGELSKWSCLSNEVIEYTKGKGGKEDKKSFFLIARAFFCS